MPELDQPAEFGSNGIDRQINSFFLACECKPGSPAFSIIDPFAYEIQPAWVQGTLGVLHYNPPIYSIITVNEDSDPLYGYILTISHPETVILLDRMKGFYGSSGFNMHVRVLTLVNIEEEKTISAWVYLLSPQVISSYESIEQIESGIWDDDQKLTELKDLIEEYEDDDDDDEEIGERI